VVVKERGYGKNYKMLNFQSLGSTGVPYSVIIAPNIEKLSRLPNHSSPNGQLLKITGKGFSKVPS